MSSLAARGKQDPNETDDSIDAPVEGDRDYTVRAVDRVCSILNLLQQSINGVTLNTVAQATGLPKSSAFRYLWTLEGHRYVERDPETSLFRLGLGFMGMQSRHLEVLRGRTRPWLETLRDEFDETANFGILDGDEIIYIDVVESRRGVRLAARTGRRDPVHTTALGKAIVAYLPESQVRDLLKRAGMAQRTANTITSIDDYVGELAKVRRLGYAVDNGENEDDGRCVAAPILGTRLPAAISVSAPSARFTIQDVERVAKTLHDVADRIAKNPGRDQLNEE